MTIRVLSPQLAGQIAAGEVVERPASAVKELLENAVDAGAHHIRCEIRAAGRQLILVRDDGAGIPADELPLALAPHATSKISSIEDLDGIRTLGFRGEALASIAAVSRLTLCSKTPSATHAFSVHVEGPQQQAAVAPAAHPDGTTVEVRELFFNTPARRRFLKSDRTEMQRIREVFVNCALAHPEIGFELLSEGKPLLRVRAAAPGDERGRRDRIARLAGRDFAGRAVAVRGEDPFLQLEGLLLPPPAPAECVREQCAVFLNGRPLSDRLLVHALREAYAQAAGRRAEPRCVLYLSCDPREVDVNVHPRKDEVRFHEPGLVHELILNTVLGTLKRAGWCAGSSLGGPFDEEAPAAAGPAAAAGAAAGTNTAGERDVPAGANPAAGPGVAGGAYPVPGSEAQAGARPGSPAQAGPAGSGAEAGPGRFPAGAGAFVSGSRMSRDRGAGQRAGSVPAAAAVPGGGPGGEGYSGVQGAAGPWSGAPAAAAARGPVYPDLLPEQRGAAARAAAEGAQLALPGESAGAVAAAAGEQAELLELLMPSLLFLRWGHTYFLAAGRLLERALLASDYAAAVRAAAVPTHLLLMPFAVRTSPELASEVSAVPEAVRRCGLVLGIQKNTLELKVVPELLRGCDLAGTVPGLLRGIVRAAPQLESGECPDELALLAASAAAARCYSPQSARDLCARIPSADFLRQHPECARELDLRELAGNWQEPGLD